MSLLLLALGLLLLYLALTGKVARFLRELGK